MAVALIQGLALVGAASAEVGDTQYLENPSPAALRLDCQAGFSFACVNLGMYYQNSETAIGRKRARDLYLQACDMGDERGCYYWRRMQPVTAESDIDYVPEVPRMNKSTPPVRRGVKCDSRHTNICVKLGKTLESTGKQADRAQARKLYDLACKMHDRVACAQAKRLAKSTHERSKSTRNPSKLVTSKPRTSSLGQGQNRDVPPLSKRSPSKTIATAKPGSVKPSVSNKAIASAAPSNAQRPVVANPVTAAKPATPPRPTPVIPVTAAKPKPATAVATATPAVAGKAATPPAKAAPAPALPRQTPASVALTSACQKGDGNACLSAGQMYSSGIGVARNPALTLKFYDRSCKLKTAPACLALGTMYEIGTGTKPDLKKAASYYQLACKNGNVIACQMTSGNSTSTSDPKQKATAHR